MLWLKRNTKIRAQTQTKHNLTPLTNMWIITLHSKKQSTVYQLITVHQIVAFEEDHEPICSQSEPNATMADFVSNPECFNELSLNEIL